MRQEAEHGCASGSSAVSVMTAGCFYCSVIGQLTVIFTADYLSVQQDSDKTSHLKMHQKQVLLFKQRSRIETFTVTLL